MNRSFFSLILLLCSAVVLFAQPETSWTRVYGGEQYDRSFGALPLSDGGFFVTGYTESFGAGFRDVWLLRLDVNGDTLWTRTYGGTEEDVGSTIIPAGNDNYWLSGRTMSYGAGGRDWLLIKIDANGDSLWSRTFGSDGGDWGGRSYSTNDGGLIISGQLADPERGAQMGIIKLDTDGDSLWSRHFGGSGHEACTDLLQTEDGGYLLAGHTDSYSVGERDFWLLKTNASGDSLWSRTYGGELTERFGGMERTIDGGYVLGGTTYSYGAGGADLWLLKVSATGDSLWSRTYGGSLDDDCRDICAAPNGGFVLAGFTREFDGGQSWLLRVDANGDSLWSLYNGSVDDDDRHYWITALADDSYLAGGLRLNHPEENDDIWLVRTGIDPVSAPPGEFHRVMPEDSTFVDGMMVPFAWTRSLDPDGDVVTYLLHVESATYPFPDPADYATTDTFLTVEIPWPLDALDERHTFEWTLRAAADGDTVGAANGDGLFFMDIVGDAADATGTVVSDYSLAVYPNPFNATATIRFAVPRRSFLQLKLFDVAGRQTAMLASDVYDTGLHSIMFNAAKIASGVYFVQLKTSHASHTSKVMLIR